MKVKALQGDTVDALCWRHYGATCGVTETVLSVNPGLSQTIALDAGQEVELPDIARDTQQERVQLWE
ncbi:tail protein X [Sodalis endosymbiont of Spalangia cameroni]|uniref:tail protein X n=1 Tax=Sodalis praecaptivus TaxID=1239307 RepID=UPI0031F9C1B0